MSETRLTAQSSRISIRVDAPFPEARFRSLSGYFEMDFSGTTPGNIAVTSSSAGFRLRQAFAEVQYGDAFTFAAGQAFTLMTPPKQQLSIWPSDYEMSQAVDTNYLAGLVWERVPQVRFTWRPTRSFNWAVSVENPEQQIGNGLVTLPVCCSADIAAQYNTGQEALSVPNLMPDFVTRLALEPFGRRPRRRRRGSARVPSHGVALRPGLQGRRGRTQRQRALQSHRSQPG